MATKPWVGVAGALLFAVGMFTALRRLDRIEMRVREMQWNARHRPFICSEK